MANLPVQCPLPHQIQSSAAVLADLQPLLQYLPTNQPIAKKLTFPRGTVLPDGRLDLCKQALGVEGCELLTTALTDNQTITSLLLGTNGIGDPGVVEVAELIRQNPHLGVIYLGCNAISGRGVAAIAEALISNQTVHSLWLKRNSIGVAGASALAEMLRHNRTIHTLDLVHTRLGDEGLAAILDVLTHANRTIKRLYLGGNQLNADHAPILAMLLQQNPTLTVLSLGVNHLGDSGVACLSEALQQNCTLQELGLASNDISEVGCDSLVAALQTHPTLCRLDLGYSPSTRALAAQPNGVGDGGAKAVAQFLAQNPAMVWLDLRNNAIGEPGKTDLRGALTHNHTLQALCLDGERDDLLERLLQRNRQLNPMDHSQMPEEVGLIQSVYR
jgi:Ran GTPase-activating protein (RanGAP) involved in mRNA processing and transport